MSRATAEIPSDVQQPIESLVDVPRLKDQLEKLQLELEQQLTEGQSLKTKIKETQKQIDTMSAENKALKTAVNEVSVQGVDEEGILMSITQSTGKNEIRGGTIDKLIERLYNQDQLSVSEYMDVFLLTFRAFTTSNFVWESLMSTYDRYNPRGPHRMATDRFSVILRQEQDEMTNQKMRLRIIVVLKRWLEHYYSDFEGELLNSFRTFVTLCQDAEGQLLKRVLEVVEKKRNGDDVNRVGFGEQPPTPILPKGTITLLDLSAVEMGRQLSLLEWDLYKPIVPKELLSLSWQKSDKQQRSPHLLKMIARFNQVSNYVAYCVVKEMDKKKRLEILCKFIQLAEELHKISNFNGVFEVTSGLNSSSVSRLKKTWEMLSSSKQKSWTMLLGFTDPSSNFRTYREALTGNASAAIIPYMGLFLSDLTFIEEGNPDKLKDSGYVNFQKCRMVADVIRQVVRFQQKPYNLMPVESISKWLLSHTPVPEKELFDLSLKAEPREPQTT